MRVAIAVPIVRLSAAIIGFHKHHIVPMTSYTRQRIRGSPTSVKAFAAITTENTQRGGGYMT